MPNALPMKIDYVEITSPKLEETQKFLSRAFGWEYQEYGDDYRDVQGAGIGGGLERGETRPPLVIINAEDLEAALEVVREAGAEITQEIFAFPGGRRFQFREPGGTEMAVWSKA